MAALTRGIFVVGAKRTPFGTFGGKLANRTPTDLQEVAAKAALSAANVNPELVDSVIIGNVIGCAHTDTIYAARHVGLRCGVPISAPALSVNRLCGSGFQSVVNGAHDIIMGDSKVVLTGGTDSMSMAPYAVRNIRFGTRLGSDLTMEWHGGVNVTSGMIEAEIKCIAIQALMDSGKIDKELKEAQELLIAAETEFTYKQEQKKENSDAGAELRPLEAEKNLIRLKMLESEENMIRLKMLESEENMIRLKIGNAITKPGNTPQQSNIKPSSSSFSSQIQKTNVVCYKCGRVGHYSRDCYQTQQQTKPVGQVVKVTDKLLRISPMVELEKKNSHMFPSCVPVRSMKRTTFASEEIEDLPVPEGASFVKSSSLGDRARLLSPKLKTSWKYLILCFLCFFKHVISAQDNGHFTAEIAPIAVKTKKGPVDMTVDEHPKPQSTLESVAKLPPVFKKNGTVTAATASGICDGAGAVVLASEEACKEHGFKPLARLVGYAVAGVDPTIMGIGPVPAIQKLLKVSGLELKDVGMVEINEAFAPQTIACQRALDLDPAILNMNGGAIALGHPLGASGSRITAHIVHEIRRRGIKYGIGSACIGGGQGIALLLESL
ncbi:3-ketoacyl-CoA thiolase, mitochondrial-like [Macrobrachium rosenbergii]|uniref:3-ketoacyl-CoA thiolase, mitochondrial-like n=1 Tax=Macrobrachium rosenbergii TaxID=79674 RepID=UPI0034D6AAC1